MTTAVWRCQPRSHERNTACLCPPCSCARDVVHVAAGRHRRGRGRVPHVLGACSRCGRRGARSGAARRGGGVGVALSVGAVVRSREDAIDLAERSDGLVEASKFVHIEGFRPYLSQLSYGAPQ